MNRMAEKTRGVLAHLTRGESGYGTLTSVLVLLFMGALIITPILAFMGVGLKAGQTHERRTDELYAADAGVNNALWHIKMGQVPEGESPLVLDEFIMNDKVVSVTVYEVSGDEPAYRIVSVANSNGTGSSTTVESYISLACSTADFLKGALTSRVDAKIKDNVEGDVICGGDLDIKAKVDGDVLCAGTVGIFPSGWVTGNVTYGVEFNNNGILDGDAYYSPGIEIPELEYWWPDADIFRELYGGQVDKSDPYLFDSIDLQGISTSIGPLYREGNLDIKNSGGPATLTLTGTVYVTGQLSIGKTGDPFTLDLNGQTIFCEYLDPIQKAIEIADRCTITGTGCIIAVGNIGFGPKMTAGGEEDGDYVIIMSIEGWTDLHPQSRFYGSVVGNELVEVQPPGVEGGGVTWVQPDLGELNFPIYNTAKIDTYNIYHYVPD